MHSNIPYMEEENLLTAIPDFKLYKDRSIYIATFLGGPLAAGYLMSENFKKISEADKAKRAWLIAIAATFGLVAALIFIPGIKKIPQYIIPIISALIAQSLVKKYQSDAINDHIDKGGRVYTIWRAVLVALIAVVALVGITVILLIITDPSILNN
ncbi:MAG: hypothetical protein ABI091_15330 [Ferruginibacter sp.]